jgi:hypothetical protein
LYILTAAQRYHHPIAVDEVPFDQTNIAGRITCRAASGMSRFTSSERTPRQVFLKFDGPRGAMSDPVFPFLERRPAYDGDIALEGVDLVYDIGRVGFLKHKVGLGQLVTVQDGNEIRFFVRRDH